MMELFKQISECLTPTSLYKRRKSSVEIEYQGVTFDVDFFYSGFDKFGNPLEFEYNGIFIGNQYWEEDLAESTVVRLYDLARKKLKKENQEAKR